MNLFQKTLRRENASRPPVWFMRQAGRYHAHYQALRKEHSFVDLCKKPEVACEATLGPIRDFDFDAAILFSDLLFPLEAMGTGLRYDEGPKLDHHLRSREDLSRLKGGVELAKHMEFQGDAMRLIRKALPTDKGLLGFVGGPFTLYCYAVEGSHQGELKDAKAGLLDGRYSGFVDKLVEALAENMAIQARGGADTIAVLDTCAGELTPKEYGDHLVPVLHDLLNKFKKRCPDTPVTYYSKRTDPAHWDQLTQLPIDAIGVDWLHPIHEVLDKYSDRWAIQGNVDPHALFLPPDELESLLRATFAQVKKLPARKLRGWVCGLGHGVLPKTPESNVKLFLRLQKEVFG